MAIVTKDSTAGVIAGGVINIGKPLQVSNGYNFPIIRAHQIGWGNSYFNSYAFSTSEELLTYIEQGIAGGGQAYTLAYGAYLYADTAYTWAKAAYTWTDDVYEYADKVNIAAGNALQRANAAYTYTENLAKNDVIPHINDNVRHLTSDERTKWDYAYSTIKTFIESEDIDKTLDTLNEIAYWLDNSGDAAELTVSLAGLSAYTYNVVAVQADAAYTWADVAYAYAGEAYTWAKKAYAYAGTADGNATIAYNWAKEAYSYAEIAYEFAGTADANAATAYNWAKEAYNYANLAYTYSYSVVGKQADLARQIASGAYEDAGKAYNWAKEAYNYANLAYTYSYSVVGQKADKAYTLAYGAYLYADTAYTWTDDVFEYAEKVNVAAGNALQRANAAYTYTENLANHVVNPHKANTYVHIQEGERKLWTEAANNINTFLNGEDIAETLDTLKEIAYWLDNSGDAAELTVSLAGLSAYTYNVVAKQADAAYTWADAAYAYAGEAYTWAKEAYTYTAAVGAVADLAYSQSNDALARISTLETTIDHNVEITYSVTSAAATGYFLASVDVERIENTNDYKLKYTYAYVPSPKAEDYWAEYAIANSFNGIVYNKYKNYVFDDLYGTNNKFKYDVYLYTYLHPTILELTADNIEASSYYFTVNGIQVTNSYYLASTLSVTVTDNKCVFTAHDGFTNAYLSIELVDAETTKTLTSAYFEINIAGEPT